MVVTEHINENEKINVVRDWYENGKLESEYSYKNGEKHGMCRSWFPEGQLYYEELFENGQLHGICRGWYRNGQLRYERPYKNGEKHGICRSWLYINELSTNYFIEGEHYGTKEEYEKELERRGEIPFSLIKAAR